MTAKSLAWRDLPVDLDRLRLPKHVAIIMDGNGRWATKRGLPRIMGHQRGADTLQDTVRCCKDWGIEALTVYAFSTENWRRPKGEVDFLMVLIEQVLRRQLQEIQEEGVRMRVVGDVSMLPPSLRQELERSVDETRENDALQFTLATNYGGRQDILQACRAIASEVEQGNMTPDELDETVFSRYLSTRELGDPDLLIRTSGEMRLSNFLLWQLAYTEIYVTETLWPDFDRSDFHRALLSFQQRDRRFGKVNA